MTLNTGQYLAPLNSGQVLSGYVQGVKQGVGVTIQPDGTLTLDFTGAATLGFLVSSSAPAPVYNWSTVAGTPQSILINDGLGNVSWSADYVQTFPQGQPFPHNGAAALPSGGTAVRPGGAVQGWIRNNSDLQRLEWYNGTNWLPVSPASGGVFSFISSLTPTANAPGDFWLDTNTNQEKVWNGVSWVPTTPLATTAVPGRVKIGANVQLAGDGTISILSTVGVAGLISNLGLTTITDNVSSLSIDSALSANQGRLLQEQINALLISSNLTFAGLVSGAGLMTYVTPEGALQGFVGGLPLPNPTVTNDEYFVIVESAGGFAPPGGVFTVVTQGDWFLSTGVAWQFLNVGYDPPYASETVPGIIELATQAETDAGTDDLRAITPLKLSGRTATETRTGIAEIATQVEANALTDDTRIVTPLKLGGVFASGAIDANDVLLNPTINGNTNVQAALLDAVYDITSPANSVTIGENPTGQFTLDIAQASEIQLGGAEIATQIETDTGTDDIRIVTPLKLAQYVAGGNIEASEIPLNPTINGYTDVQQALGNALYDIVSPSSTLSITENPTGLIDIDVVQATEGQLGGAQIATDVETQALALDTVIVTPLKLGNLFASGAIDANDILLNPIINGNTDVQAALNDAIYDVSSSDNSVTVVETAVGQVDLTVAQATETQIGGGEIATQAEANAGLSDIVLITPQKLAGYIASGQIEASEIVVNPTINGNANVQSALADAVYDITSTGNTVVITSSPTGLFNVEVRQATEIQLGGAEIATQVETNALTNDSVIVTPLKLGGLFSSGSIDANDILLNPAINGNTNVQAALLDAVYDITSTGNTIVVTSAATGLFNVEVRQATETQLGGAEIATQIETETGTDDTRIVTPLKLRTAAVYKSDFNAKGDLLSASANDTPVILPVGTNAQVLTVDLTTATGLKWSSPAAAAIYNLDDISGSFNGATTSFNLAIGGVAYAPTPVSNIMVFLGGVAQIPGAGNAYTIAGSTINFISAPPAGMTFYATTVR